MTFFNDYIKLDLIGTKFNTNKAGRCVHNELGEIDRLSLLRRYEFFLDRLVSNVGINKISMLELGAGVHPDEGASGKM